MDAGTIGPWVNGSYLTTASGPLVHVESPWDGTRVCEFRAAGQGVVSAAVDAAGCAFLAHRFAPVGVRARWCARIADAIENAADRLVDLVVVDIGKPRRAARVEVNRTAAFCAACARAIQDLSGEVVPLDAAVAGEGLFGFARRVPFGVVAAITPFNAPANLLMQKVAPALVAGNSLVVKPSVEGTRVALALAECCQEAGVPDGLLNVVPGGAEEALTLASHPRVDVVTVTASTATGEALAKAAGIKKFVGELGGNSPNIVLADADIADAAKRIATSAFEAAGQQCISAQRIIVVSEVYEQFASAFVDATRRLVVGDPSSEETDVGPVVNQRAADRIMRAIDEAVLRGAGLLTQPNRVGCLIHPTIVFGARRDSSIVTDEIFGPVAILLRARDAAEAIEISNESVFGLQAACFTRSIDAVMNMSNRLNVGSIWINEGSRFRLDNYPFGGVGRSGHGREGVRYAIEEYSQWKFTGVRSIGER
jgi:acyl-CoA reductase-like NAD-dependent aldehyde dehydrogenase